LGSDKATLEAVLAALEWERVAVAGEDKPDVWRRMLPKAGGPRRPRSKDGAKPHKPGGPRQAAKSGKGRAPGKANGKAGGKSRGAPVRKPREKQPDPNSPFAQLKALLNAD
jgi:hypothetical protein